jgi:hypothetical protein
MIFDFVIGIPNPQIRYGFLVLVYHLQRLINRVYRRGTLVLRSQGQCGRIASHRTRFRISCHFHFPPHVRTVVLLFKF